MNTVVWYLVTGILVGGVVYFVQESRHHKLRELLETAKGALTVAETQRTDLNGRYAAQADELRQSMAANRELSIARERLEANFQNAAQNGARLQDEINRLRPELEAEQRRCGDLDAGRQVASARIESLELAGTELQQRFERSDSDKSAAHGLLTQATAHNAALVKESEGLRAQLVSQKQWIEEQTAHFERRVLATAATLMEERGRAFTETNRKEVDAVIAPFKEHLAEFRQRVDHIYASENTQRGELRQQIEHLTNLNQTVSNQAERLTNALTVTSKSTGDWGETILKKILEDSGLREGKEYQLQHSIVDADGDRVQPDAVIFLPENRQLVVDSKVSNKAWKEYCNESNEELRGIRLKEHLASLRAHVETLSGKDYSRSPDLQSVDFAVMFVPVEAALLKAFEVDESLYSDAFRSKVILVVPSTLMAVVKMVEGLWTLQKRKESADQIADAGRRLYEKLTTFAVTFIEVGEAIERSHGTFERAQGQLATGKGNAIRLAQRMVELGVAPATGKAMPLQLSSDMADAEENSDGQAQPVDTVPVKAELQSPKA
jgi:DNA recombination protein RmuC